LVKHFLQHLKVCKDVGVYSVLPYRQLTHECLYILSSIRNGDFCALSWKMYLIHGVKNICQVSQLMVKILSSKVLQEWVFIFLNASRLVLLKASKLLYCRGALYIPFTFLDKMFWFRDMLLIKLMTFMAVNETFFFQGCWKSLCCQCMSV
jgi:hypothetical protein